MINKHNKLQYHKMSLNKTVNLMSWTWVMYCVFHLSLCLKHPFLTVEAIRLDRPVGLMQFLGTTECYTISKAYYLTPTAATYQVSELIYER